MKKVSKRLMGIVLTVAMLLTCMTGVGVMAEGTDVTSVTLAATSYMTDGVLVPSYTLADGVSEADSTYRYLMADTADAPINYWEEIVYGNANLSASGAISQNAAYAAYLLLSPEQAGKYVKIELTVNGNKYYSAPTPKITYTPNILNNGELSTVGINSETGEVYGWSDGAYDSAKAAIKTSGAEVGNNWYNRFDFPMALSAGSYSLTESATYASGAGKNFRANYSGTDLGNGKWTAGKQGAFATGTFALTFTEKTEPYLSFRICTGSAAGAENFWMKDLSLIKVAPYVKDVAVGGELSVWGTAMGNYTYRSEYDAEGVAESSSVYAWYMSDNNYGPWEKIGNAQNLSIPTEANGKYLKFEVTPVNANGVSGTKLSAISDTKVAAGNGVALLAVDGRYTTDGILYPQYIYTGEGEEGTSTYRYLMADTADAPYSAWEEIVYSNPEVAVGTEITESTAKNAFLLLNPDLVGKYIRIEIVPKDKEGKSYDSILSDPTPRIEYTPNLFNNPTFSTEAIDANGNIMGWFDTEGDTIALASDRTNTDELGSLAVRPNDGEVGYGFGTYTILSRKLIDTGTKFNIAYDVYKITGGNSNFRMKFGNNAMLTVAGANNTHNNNWTRISNLIESNLGNANSGNIAFSMSGSAGGAAGQINVDNVSITPAAPYATNVAISGTVKAGETVTAVYTYNNEYDGQITETDEEGTETTRAAVESGTVITWWVSDNAYGPWTNIQSGTSKNLTLTDENAGKYLRVTVKAKSEYATSAAAIPSYDTYIVEESGQEVDPGIDLPAFDAGDPFKAYIAKDAPTPEIIDEYDSEIVDNITVRKFRFALRDYVDSDDDQTKTAVVYAIMAYPTDAAEKLPGIVYLHGGGGSADASKDAVVAWAKEGYIVIAPDVPGVYKKADGVEDLSYGNWSKYEYANNRFNNDVTNSTIFDGALAAVQSYNLLIAQELTDVDRVGTTGTSWGGYNTTMLSGLLGDRIKATYSRYTGGFFDVESSFSSAKNSPNWLKYIDAGRRAPNMTSNYFLMAAAKDTFMQPGTINRSFEETGSANKNMVYAPNASHSPSGITGGDDMDVLWMNYYLKGEGTAFPKVTEMTSTVDENAFTRTLTINVSSELPVTSVKVYYSTPDVAWTKRTWNSFDAVKLSDGVYEAVLSKIMLQSSVDYYVVATDGVASGGTLIYSSREGINTITLKDLTITATSLKTDGVVVPGYTVDSEASMGAVEGKSTYRYLMADTQDAPISAWEEIDITHTRRSTPTTITADTAQQVYMNLGPSQRGKYIKLEVTPVDSAGNAGTPQYSNVIGPIEFTTNLLNNGNFETLVNLGNFSGEIGADGAHVLGYTNSIATGNTTPRIWPTEKFEYGLYKAQADVKLDEIDGVSKTTNAMLFFESTSANWRSANATVTSDDWTTVSGTYAVTNTDATKDKAENVQLGLRVYGGDFTTSQADYWVKNYTVKRIAPYATDVVVSGTGETGTKLTASYGYNASDDEYSGVLPNEGASVYKWYVSDNAYGPWVEYATGSLELTVSSELEGKYVRFEVTPVDDLSTPRIGYSQVSNTVAIEKPDITIDFVNITGSVASGHLKASVQLTNNALTDFYPSVMLVAYRLDDNGEKQQVADVSMDSKKLQVETNNLFEPELDITDTKVEVRLYIWESMTSIKPLKESVVIK